jgi:diguanylate cyclase (GGDEF)-like protein
MIATEIATLSLSGLATVVALALLWLAGLTTWPTILLVLALAMVFSVGYLTRKIQGDRLHDAALLNELFQQFGRSEKVRQEVSQRMRDLAAVAAENARLFEEAQQRTQELTNLLKLSETLSSTLNAPSLLQLVSRQVRELVGCDFFAFLHVDREANTLVPAVVLQPEVGPPIDLPPYLGEGLPGRVAQLGKADFVNRTNEALWREPAESLGSGLHSGIGIPLVVEGRIDGVIALGRIGTQGFDRDDLRLLAIIAGQIGAALENVRLHERVKDQAVRDSLTQVFNHSYLYARLAEEVARSEQLGVPVSFIMLDIDNFKAFNDTHGHLAGDEVLRKVARTLENSVRKVDIVARYGGEEFGVVLPQTPQNGAYMVSERIRRAVEEMSAGPDAPAARVTVSIGLATCPDVATTYVDLVARADEALYRGKALGKNRVCVATAD